MFIIFLIIIGIVIMVIFDGKKGSTYQKKLTPTMKFIIAAGANTYQNADCSRVDIGGNPANSWAKKHMRKLLKSGWNIKSSEDLRETISWLFNEGHNKECLELVERYKDNSKFLENEKISKGKLKNLNMILDAVTGKFESQGIMAWDLCRICNLAGWGFLAQYITYDEAIQISVDACKILQANYTSWDNMMESYFLGLWYWCEDYTSTQNRMGWYESSKKNQDSIYNIPWDTILDVKDIVPPRKR